MHKVVIEIMDYGSKSVDEEIQNICECISHSLQGDIDNSQGVVNVV
jgi:hypothetical protein